MKSTCKAAPQVDAAPRKPVAAPTLARVPRLQRKCACGGGGGGECESCKKKPKEMLQRKSVGSAPPPVAAAAVAKSPPRVPESASVPKPAIPAKAADRTPGKPGAEAKPQAEAKQRAEAKQKTDAGPQPAAPGITEKKKPVADSAEVPPVVHRVLDTPGRPLDLAVSSEMEARFGRDFSDVRIHTDTLAASAAREVQAQAFTVGQHIVFDAGQYQPETPEGRRLLAHELAHTIQQHGLQKASRDIAMDFSGEYNHLEREADSVSNAVMQRPSMAGAPLSPGQSSRPMLSRANKSKAPLQDAKGKAGKKDKKDKWVDVDEDSDLGKAGVKQISKNDADASLVAVVMKDPFLLPPEKGDKALPLWEAQAKAGTLQAIMAPGDTQPTTTTGVKQARPATDDLRDRWLVKLGWKDDSALGLWKKAAKKAGLSEAQSTFRPTKAGGMACDVDHILELQFGGNNLPQNVQMLDYSPNRSSGSQIGQYLKTTAFAISTALTKEAMDAGGPKPDITGIRLEYKSVALAPGTVECQCCKVESAAPKVELTEDEKGGSSGTRYPMKSGAFTGCAVANEETVLKLRESDLPENKYVSTLVPGLQLVQWTRPSKPKDQKVCGEEGEKPDTPAQTAGAAGKSPAAKSKVAGKAPDATGGKVSAVVDPTSRILTLLKLKEGQSVELSRDPAGNLKAPEKDPKLAFAIDYLSDGVIHKLKIDDDGSVSGSGTINPSVPFLPKPFEFAFDKNKFAMTTDVKKPRLPIPGAEITEAKIGLQIAPEFKPEGKVAFQVSHGGRKFLHGELRVSADEKGLVVEGDVFASIPGVDEAKGSIQLKNHEWSGGVDIKAGDFSGKLKYVKSGEVAIRFSEKEGMSGTGSVELNVPGVSNPVQAKVSYDRANGWAYSGDAIFNPPRIKPVKIHLEYANGHLSGSGKTGIEFNHLSGDINVAYKDEQFSGDATLGIKTERAEGVLKLVMKPRPDGPPVFSGEGLVTYQITPNLVATAGIKIDEHEKVTFTGEILLPKPIDLFDGFHGNYDIFSVDLPIPIPGANIGGVGLEAVITGALSAGYDVGPVQLLDTKAKASFQPLEPNPELEMDFTSRIHLAASVHVTGSITGDVKIEAYIASVSGGLTLSATATLAGAADLPVSAHYKDGKISADVGFSASLALSILLALTAHVRAKAGVGWLSVSTGKEWDLGKYNYDTGLKLGMSLKKPIHYATGEGLTLPSASDINWVTPDIDVKDALKKVFGAGEKPEHDD